jgi:hypothetical protein
MKPHMFIGHLHHLLSESNKISSLYKYKPSNFITIYQCNRKNLSI